MSFKVNDKVVCVDAAPRTGTINGEYDYPGGFLEHGAIYCVERYEYDPSYKDPHRVCIVGKPAIWKHDGTVCGWNSNRFRLVSTTKETVRTAIDTAVEAGK